MTLVAAEMHQTDEKEMQVMMEQMQKMQDCMQKIDSTEITTAEQLAMKVSTEAKALCADGKHDQAQEHVISFSKQLAKMPALKELRRCSEMATGMAPMMPILDQYKTDNFVQYHVCDH
jgi:hypothetical protein